jgi:hypothetical protein
MLTQPSGYAVGPLLLVMVIESEQNQEYIHFIFFWGILE